MRFQVDVVTNNALDEFDKKLAEADAYLQLLLGNIKVSPCDVSSTLGQLMWFAAVAGCLLRHS